MLSLFWIGFAGLSGIILAQTPAELVRYTGVTLPAPDFEPGTVIVKTKAPNGFQIQSASLLPGIAKKMGAVSIREILLPSARIRGQAVPVVTYVMRFAPTVNIGEVIREFAASPEVDYAEPNYIFKLFSPPNDPDYAQQAYLNQTNLAPLLTMPVNYNVVVAVVDTGVDLESADLKPHLVSGNAFTLSRPDNVPIDENGHGTHLAGIIAAVINNKTGIVGLNPRARIMPLRVTNAAGAGTQLDAAEAIRYAADNGARIINCSWGYYVYSQILKDAVDYAISKGVIVVAAMGNDGSNLKQFPAAFPGVLAIGAIGIDMKRAGFSNIGDHISFVEYGVDIVSTLPGGKTGKKSGTSQSAAIVSGIISRMLSYKSTLTASEISTLLIFSAESLGDGHRTPETGLGVISIEGLFRTMNIPSSDQVIGEDGGAIQDVTPVHSPDPEPFWLSILLFPYRIIAGIIGFLI